MKSMSLVSTGITLWYGIQFYDPGQIRIKLRQAENKAGFWMTLFFCISKCEYFLVGVLRTTRELILPSSGKNKNFR